MSRQKYVVQLADDERERLQKLVRGGVSPAREVVRARILLKADAGWKVVRIADALDVAPATVCRIKKRFLDEGLQSALEERQRPGRPPKLDEKGEAHLIAIACSPTPRPSSSPCPSPTPRSAKRPSSSKAKSPALRILRPAATSTRAAPSESNCAPRRRRSSSKTAPATGSLAIAPKNSTWRASAEPPPSSAACR